MQSNRLQSGLFGSMLIHITILGLLYFANLDAKPKQTIALPITVSLVDEPKSEPLPQKQRQTKKIKKEQHKEPLPTPIKQETKNPAKEESAVAKIPQKQTDAEQKPNIAKTNDDEIKKYLLEIRKKLQNNLEYPYFAKKAGIEGVVHLQFCIKRDGSLGVQSIKVVKSSGYAALDRQAIETLQSSAPFATPPNGEIELSIPVSFSIKS